MKFFGTTVFVSKFAKSKKFNTGEFVNYLYYYLLFINFLLSKFESYIFYYY